MTALYRTLPASAQLAIDAFNAAQYVYESSREEEHRVVMECEREVMLREILAWAIRRTIENDEAA